MFDQTSFNPRFYSDPQLKFHTINPQNSEEFDHDTTATTQSTFASVCDSPSTSFTTPRNANFFVGSLSNATDNTNVSMRSVTEDLTDVEITGDDDERMHSVLTDVEINQAYAPDDVETDVLRTNL